MYIALYLPIHQVDQFLDSLINFDKENIAEANKKAVQPYLDDKEFDPDFIRSKSAAAAGTYVHMYTYMHICCVLTVCDVTMGTYVSASVDVLLRNTVHMLSICNLYSFTFVFGVPILLTNQHSYNYACTKLQLLCIFECTCVWSTIRTHIYNFTLVECVCLDPHCRSVLLGDQHCQVL